MIHHSTSQTRTKDIPEIYSENYLVALLSELYRPLKLLKYKSDSLESDDTFLSNTSSSVSWLGESLQLSLYLYSNSDLQQCNNISELRVISRTLVKKTNEASERLLKLLRKRERLRLIINKNCDILTAILQACSPKRSIDTKMRFSLYPLQNTETAYNQWIRALKSMTRFSDGIPCEFRKQIWLNLADYYLKSSNIDWPSVRNVCFNDSTNPDDYDLDAQIIKDLHRTNSAGVPGTSLSNEDRLTLKRVLLAFARWNKKIGYCQGLNVIAALIIDVMEHEEESALKVMIYLIDHILPPRYYTNNLSGLTVDMSVFRDLLVTRYPQLATQLDKLRNNISPDKGGGTYEPPLTNLFIMQWFITIFATCFPRQTVLQIWDCLLIHGSEVLIRTALVFWKRLLPVALMAQNADQFYALMDDILKRCLEPGRIPVHELIKDINELAPFPYKEIEELRDKYTYNISPFTTNNQDSKEYSSKILDLGLSKLIQSLNPRGNKKFSLKTPSKNVLDVSDQLALDPNPSSYVYDVKGLRTRYKKICQNHKKSMLIISNYPNAYREEKCTEKTNYKDNCIRKNIPHTHTNNNNSITSPSSVTTQQNRTPPSIIIEHDNNARIQRYDSISEFDFHEPINHLYLKPGSKAKHRKNKKSIRYTTN